MLDVPSSSARTARREALTLSVAAPPGALLVAATGVATPHDAVESVAVEGGRIVSVAQADGLDLAALVIAPERAEVALRYTVVAAAAGAVYPEAAFRPRDTRYSRAAAELVADARRTAERVREGGGDEPAVAAALAEAARARFSYGHPEARFNDGCDAVPYLACGTTPGSCVDINTYFMASLRAAGIEAAYFYGAFFPRERDRTEGGRVVHATRDGHCWVATRHPAGDGGMTTLEWDIAHHMKAGLGPVRPALDPRPGRRVALSHSMGHVLEVGGARIEAKVLGTPVVVRSGGAAPAEITGVALSEAAP